MKATLTLAAPECSRGLGRVSHRHKHGGSLVSRQVPSGTSLRGTKHSDPEEEEEAPPTDSASFSGSFQEMETVLKVLLKGIPHSRSIVAVNLHES